MQPSFTPNVIPNIHTENVDLDKKRPRFADVTLNYKIKRTFTFLSVNTIYISSLQVVLLALSLVLRTSEKY